MFKFILSTVITIVFLQSVYSAAVPQDEVLPLKALDEVLQSESAFDMTPKLCKIGRACGWVAYEVNSQNNTLYIKNK